MSQHIIDLVERVWVLAVEKLPSPLSSHCSHLLGPHISLRLVSKVSLRLNIKVFSGE